MKRRDIYIILFVLLVALGARYMAARQGAPAPPQKTEQAEAASTPEAAPTAEAERQPEAGDGKAAAEDEHKIRPAQSFLRIQVGSETHSIVPLNKKDTIEVRQPNGSVNVIDIDVNSVRMHSSTCKNQECIHQGEVTLENIHARPLYNTIVCLPNKVLLELLTPEEAARASGLAR